MDKKIIKDLSFIFDALDEVKDELDSKQDTVEEIKDYINKELTKVNSKIDSICSLINAIQESKITNQEITDQLDKMKADVIAIVRQENNSTLKEIDKIRMKSSV